MRILFERGDDRVARVLVAATEDGHRFELVDSAPHRDTWSLAISTLVGCPVRCLMCDAGGAYEGRLTASEMLDQIDVLVRRRFPDGRVTWPRFEVQFSRMGDPAFNASVLDVLEALPRRFEAPGLVPCLSTVAPASRQEWFEQLRSIKRRLYRGRRFQLQFSVHSTDPVARRRLVPVRCWSFDEMADYGRSFHEAGDEKIVLGIAAARGEPLNAAALRQHFDPARFAVKLTPLNPTRAAAAAGLVSLLEPNRVAEAHEVAAGFEGVGFETTVVFGAAGEDEIGASCGMHVGGRDGGVPRPRRTRGRKAPAQTRADASEPAVPPTPTGKR